MQNVTKNFRLIVQLKNNQLLKRREKLKATQKELALAIGIPINQYSGLETMRFRPIQEGSRFAYWTKYAIAIAEYFECIPEELFPDEVIQIKKPIASREINFSDIAELGTKEKLILDDPENQVASQQLIHTTENVLNRLTSKERDIVRKYFGMDEPAMNLEEIGKLHKLSPGRTNLILAQALRKLRHPDRAKYLKSFRSM